MRGMNKWWVPLEALQATVEYNCYCCGEETAVSEVFVLNNPLTYKQLQAVLKWRAFCRERLQKLRDGATSEQIPDDTDKKHVYPPS